MGYVFKAIAFFCLFMAMVFGFNWWVDPWGYFGRYPFGVYGDGTFRHIKALRVSRDRPEAVVFGASTAVQIDPPQLSGCHFYNAAFNGARPTEVLYFIRNFLPPETRTVVIGLDFFTFNKSSERAYLDPDFGRFTVAKTFSYTLSMQGTLDSYKAIRYSRRTSRPQMLNPSGQREVASLLEGNAQLDYDHGEELRGFRTALFGDWQYNQQRLHTLREIRDELSRRGVAVAVYISPMADTLQAMIGEMGIYPDLEQFRHDVAELFPGAIDFTRTLTAKEYYYKRDPLHFLPSTGAIIMGQVLSGSGICGDMVK